MLMGMFDYVNFEFLCPHCKHTTLEPFQTKDGDRVLAVLSPAEVEHFYTHCIRCEAWVEFTHYKKGWYELTVKPPNEPIHPKRGIGDRLEFLRLVKVTDEPKEKIHELQRPESS